MGVGYGGVGVLLDEEEAKWEHINDYDNSDSAGDVPPISGRKLKAADPPNPRGRRLLRSGRAIIGHIMRHNCVIGFPVMIGCAVNDVIL